VSITSGVSHPSALGGTTALRREELVFLSPAAIDKEVKKKILRLTRHERQFHTGGQNEPFNQLFHAATLYAAAKMGPSR
jgi:hypothetical protein